MGTFAVIDMDQEIDRLTHGLGALFVLPAGNLIKRLELRRMEQDLERRSDVGQAQVEFTLGPGSAGPGDLALVARCDLAVAIDMMLDRCLHQAGRGDGPARRHR